MALDQWELQLKTQILMTKEVIHGFHALAMQESVEETIEIESSYFEETTEATGTTPNTELPFLYNDVHDLVICDNRNKVNSRNGIDTHKVFDEMPDQIRAESETEFSDLYLCRTILSETPELKIVIQDINKHKKDNTILVNNDEIVEMDDSKNLVFRDFQSFGDIVCCVCDFWGQKSLKEGVVSITRMVTERVMEI